MPVAFILSVTGIKDAYENYRKEQSDYEVNAQLTEVISTQHGETRYDMPFFDAVAFLTEISKSTLKKGTLDVPYSLYLINYKL